MTVDKDNSVIEKKGRAFYEVYEHNAFGDEVYDTFSNQEDAEKYRLKQEEDLEICLRIRKVEPIRRESYYEL